MKKNLKETRSEAINHAVTTLRDISLSFMPGGQVVDSFLSFRSKLKEKRLLSFVEQLRKVFELELDFDLVNYNFETEDFVDIMDSILKKVLETKSEIKLIRFRNILAKQIISPIDNLAVNNYVRLVNELNEIELVMLDRVPNLDKRFYNGLTEKHMLHYITEIEFHKANGALDHGFNIKLGLEDVFVSGKDLSFYINNLVSKGLLSRIQTGTTRMTDISGKNRLEYQYLVTDIGIDFLQFIELYKPDEGT